eukprot:tig00000403_g282.t1
MNSAKSDLKGKGALTPSAYFTLLQEFVVEPDFPFDERRCFRLNHEGLVLAVPADKATYVMQLVDKDKQSRVPEVIDMTDIEDEPTGQGPPPPAPRAKAAVPLNFPSLAAPAAAAPVAPVAGPSSQPAAGPSSKPASAASTSDDDDDNVPLNRLKRGRDSEPAAAKPAAAKPAAAKPAAAKPAAAKPAAAKPAGGLAAKLAAKAAKFAAKFAAEPAAKPAAAKPASPTHPLGSDSVEADQPAGPAPAAAARPGPADAPAPAPADAPVDAPAAAASDDEDVVGRQIREATQKPGGKDFLEKVASDAWENESVRAEYGKRYLVCASELRMAIIPTSQPVSPNAPKNYVTRECKARIAICKRTAEYDYDSGEVTEIRARRGMGESKMINDSESSYKVKLGGQDVLLTFTEIEAINRELVHWPVTLDKDGNCCIKGKARDAAMERYLAAKARLNMRKTAALMAETGEAGGKVLNSKFGTTVQPNRELGGTTNPLLFSCGSKARLQAASLTIAKAYVDPKMLRARAIKAFDDTFLDVIFRLYSKQEVAQMDAEGIVKSVIADIKEDSIKFLVEEGIVPEKIVLVKTRIHRAFVSRRPPHAAYMGVCRLLGAHTGAAGSSSSPAGARPARGPGDPAAPGAAARGARGAVSEPEAMDVDSEPAADPEPAAESDHATETEGPKRKRAKTSAEELTPEAKAEKRREANRKGAETKAKNEEAWARAVQKGYKFNAKELEKDTLPSRARHVDDFRKLVAEKRAEFLAVARPLRNFEKAISNARAVIEKRLAAADCKPKEKTALLKKLESGGACDKAEEALRDITEEMVAGWRQTIDDLESAFFTRYNIPNFAPVAADSAAVAADFKKIVEASQRYKRHNPGFGPAPPSDDDGFFTDADAVDGDADADTLANAASEAGDAAGDVAEALLSMAAEAAAGTSTSRQPLARSCAV